MDKTIKRKIRHLWRARLFVSTIGLVIVGFSIVQPFWALKLTHLIEEVSDSRKPLKEKNQLYSDIQQIAKGKNLPATSSIANQRLSFKDFYQLQVEDDSTQQTLDMAIVLQQELRQSASQAQYIYRGTDHKTALLRTLKESAYQAEALENRLKQDIATKQDINQIFTHIQKKGNQISPSYIQELQHKLTYLSENLIDALQIAIIKEEINRRYGLELLILYISAISLAVSLLYLGFTSFLLNRVQGDSRLSLSTQIAALFPEESVAEIEILKRRMERSSKSSREINLRISEEYIRLFWAFYVQIRLENLLMPLSDHRIDD